MGRSSRPKPDRLAIKLKQIRVAMGLSQERMLDELDYKKSPLSAAHISEYENDKREPPILVVLHYARFAGIEMEVLVDDSLDLPERLVSS